MFGANPVSTDYTFTQQENRLFTNQISKAISTYVGNFGINKKDKETDSVADSDLNKSLIEKNGNKNKNNVPKILSDNSDESQSQTKEIFDDDTEEIAFSYDRKNSASITTSFEALAAALGVSGDKITKGQLFAFLQSLTSDSEGSEKNSKEIAFVKSLIAKFDTISDGKDYITSYREVNEPQDYETVTQDQVTPPIDIRI